MNTEMIVGTCGSINERGFINSLDRGGFTHAKCLAELVANICDAHATEACVDVGLKEIRLIDNGIGMSVEKISDMFATFKENHAEEKSMGVSGFGSKPALYILSKKNEMPTPVNLYTHSAENEYIKATVPFDEMKKTGCYSGMIKYSQMTEEEIAKFIEDRNGNNTGTTIAFEYSEKTHDSFKNQFYDSKQMEMNDRLDCIFGKSGLNLYYKDFELSKKVKMELYDYFSGERPEYYIGIKEDIIEHWIDKDGNDHFICNIEGHEFEFKMKTKNAKTVGTKLEEVKNKTGWKQEGFYLLKNGIRRDTSLFDDNNPECHRNEKDIITYGTSSASSKLSEYDNKFFDSTNRDDIKEFIAKLQINRNNQYVTSIEIDGFKISSARGNADSYMKTVLFRTELSYETKSCQDNRMDIAMGIQGNKNQHCNKLPKNLMRLISHIKAMRYAEIIEYFKFKCEDKFKQLEMKRLAELELETKRLAELEMKRLAEIESENKRLAEIESENKRLAEIESENKRLAEIESENKRLAELEIHRLAKEEFENIKRAEIENKRLAELEIENIKRAELEIENKRLAEIEEIENIKRAELEEIENIKRAELEEIENKRLAELEIENKRLAELEIENKRLVEIESENKRLAELEIIAKTRKLTESTQIRISVKQGVELLKQIQKSNDAKYEDAVSSMIISYLENSTANDIKFVLKFITFSEKINCLLQLIELRYQGNAESDMKEGSRLYKLFNP